MPEGWGHEGQSDVTQMTQKSDFLECADIDNHLVKRCENGRSVLKFGGQLRDLDLTNAPRYFSRQWHTV